MQSIQYIEESKTWVCPKTGKYKVICVGGGGTGILYTTSTEVASQYIYQNGRPTSFGSYLTANGSQISNPKSTLCTDNDTDININYKNISNYTHIGGYGGYDGNRYGGNPESFFYNGGYNTYLSNGIGGNAGGIISYSPPEGNGGSISDSSMSGNYGSGGFSKILVNKASKLSTLKFTYKAYYNSPNQYVSAGFHTLAYYGDGRFITQKEMLPDINLPIPRGGNVNFTAPGNTSSSTHVEYYKYVFDTAPVVSSTSAVVPLYPIKARNNGCMKVSIIDLNEGDEIPCTIGSGGRAQDAGIGSVTDKSYLNSGLSASSDVDFSQNIGDGSDGVIIIQFLGE